MASSLSLPSALEYRSKEPIPFPSPVSVRVNPQNPKKILGRIRPYQASKYFFTLLSPDTSSVVLFGQQLSHAVLIVVGLERTGQAGEVLDAILVGPKTKMQKTHILSGFPSITC